MITENHHLLNRLLRKLRHNERMYNAL